MANLVAIVCGTLVALGAIASAAVAVINGAIDGASFSAIIGAAIGGVSGASAGAIVVHAKTNGASS